MSNQHDTNIVPLYHMEALQLSYFDQHHPNQHHHQHQQPSVLSPITLADDYYGNQVITNNTIGNLPPSIGSWTYAQPIHQHQQQQLSACNMWPSPKLEKVESFLDQQNITSSGTDETNVSSVVNSKKKRKSSKSTYKHIPHREKPVHLVAKRNARERKRVQAVNMAFVQLRKCVPVENRNKRLSKVKTLHRAIEYIRGLTELLSSIEKDDDNGVQRQENMCATGLSTRSSSSIDSTINLNQCVLSQQSTEPHSTQYTTASSVFNHYSCPQGINNNNSSAFLCDQLYIDDDDEDDGGDEEEDEEDEEDEDEATSRHPSSFLSTKSMPGKEYYMLDVN